MSSIIQVNELSKCYFISHEEKEKYISLRDEIGRRSKKLFSFSNTSKTNGKVLKEEFWALKDINFNIEKGDRVGIIGRNGAGKSTLLKILSRITDPTRGSIKIKGRIASLLEVGTGFHPELTGRENIFLNGAILGMSRAEIKKHFDAIVDFAEVEKFLDTPVKRYSSGMYVRLAFAVAAHLEPQILIVDEVLAVGDAQFQKKCLGKMNDVSKNEGRTILFVSHNMTAIKSLCRSIVYMQNGKILEIGDTNTVINNYLSHNINSSLRQYFDDPEVAPGNEFVKMKRLEVCPVLSKPSDPITVNTAINIEFEFWNTVIDKEINLSLHVYTITKECVFNVGSHAALISEGLHKGICSIPGNLLNDGIYLVSMMVVAQKSYALFNFEEVVSFEVNENRAVSGWHGKWPGIIRPKLDFNFQ